MRIPRLLSLLATLAGFACPAAVAQQGRAGFDPYDPASLNEAAADSVRRADLRTAWILLERAARIAPYDGRIVRNRDEVRAHRAASPATGATMAPEVRAAPASPAAPVAPLVPEPPPLWPRKP